MMMLQKYQFKLRDCSHIFSCHKEVAISLTKKYKSFKFTVATAIRLHLLPVANSQSSKFSPTSLSEMKANDVKNSYCVLKQ
jgi:hypothetical protein